MQRALRQYRTVLASEPQVARLLRLVPWMLDGGRQDAEALHNQLLNEAERYDDLIQGTWSGLAGLDRIRFSIITPMWNTPPRYLDELIASLVLSTWPQWELLLVDDASSEQGHLAVAESWSARDARIRLLKKDQQGGISAARNYGLEYARGSYWVFLDHDDLLHPQILGMFAQHLQKHPELSLLFSDELKISDDLTTVSEFFSKPGFDLPSLERTNYICHLTAVNAEHVRTSMQGEYFRSQFDGVEDHDFFLRLARSQGFKAGHIPAFGYYWRKTPLSTAENILAKPAVLGRGAALAADYVARYHPGRSMSFASFHERDGNRYHSWHFSPRGEPRVAVIVPFRDKVELTLGCIAAIERQKTTLRLTVLLVDNGSSQTETKNALEALIDPRQEVHAADPAIKISKPLKHQYRLLQCPAAFNYSLLNNWALAKWQGAEPDFVLFLNNDVELLSPNALDTMAGELQAHPDTAFVGIRLMRQDGSVQHGGVKVGSISRGQGFVEMAHIHSEQEFCRDERVVPAVTFACAMTPYRLWQSLGGFDVFSFANGYSDCDVCIRAWSKGLRSFQLGTVVGVHQGSKSRTIGAEEAERLMLDRLHAATLARLKLLHFGYDLSPAPPPAQQGVTGAPPLRYVVADKINLAAKRLTGPLHRVVKKALTP